MGDQKPLGAPAEVFMGLEFKEGALEGTSGGAEYPDESLKFETK
jgi:predicted N-acetyltransferase YhbS